jgi:hypothetical protein
MDNSGMDNSAGSQADVLESIRRSISLSEAKRRKLRFEHNMDALTQGRLLVLGNDEFVSDLAEYFPESYTEKKDQSRKILIALGEAAVSTDRRIRERTLAVLSRAAFHFTQRDEKGGIFILAHSFCKWLEFETDVLPGLEVVVKRIEVLSAWLLKMSCWKDAEKIISLLARIRSREIEKSPAIWSLVGKSLGSLATETLIERLTGGYLLDDDDRQTYRGILHSFGTPAADYLLARAVRSSDHQERLALVDLLPAFGEYLLPVLEQWLQQELSWAELRTLIYIIAETGEDSIYPRIQRYFGHEDRRIQHEMIRCVVKLAGRAMKVRLLDGLGAVNDSLKIYIIRMLAEFDGKDESILSALCDLAEERSAHPADSDNDLLSAVIAALGAFPSQRSIDMLGYLRRQYENCPESDNLLLQIHQTLKKVTPRLRHNQRSPASQQETVSFESDPVQKQIAYNKAIKTEEAVRKLLRQGDSKGAGKLLYEHALAAGRERDFVTAEMLRDRILEVDPMALAELVELGEWIEEQKTALIGDHHLEIWSNLYEEMTTEEFTALYQELRREEYRKGDLIVEAGESDVSLYFLNSGYISLNCIIGGNEHFLKRMGPGDVLGSEQFFSASVWTVSLRALSHVEVQVLDHDAFTALTDIFPELGQKLLRYCDRYAKIPELLKMSGDDRREYPRFSLTLSTQNYLRDPYGTKGARQFCGELVDISRNGLAFAVRLSSRSSARLLLGRPIVSVIQAGGESLVQCFGIVVGVRTQDAVVMKFTVHVKLAKKIDDSVFKRIVSMGR